MVKEKGVDHMETKLVPTGVATRVPLTVNREVQLGVEGLTAQREVMDQQAQ